MKHAPLEAVYIYFDTATYDEIERDEKVALEAEKSSLPITNMLIKYHNDLIIA